MTLDPKSLVYRLTQETSRAAKEVFAVVERPREERSETAVCYAVETYMVWKGLLGAAEHRDVRPDYKKNYLPPDQVLKAIGCLPSGSPDTRREAQLIMDICLPRADTV